MYQSTLFYLALVALLSLASCIHATTAYSADAAKSWTCFPNPETVKSEKPAYPGEKPLTVVEEKK